MKKTKKYLVHNNEPSNPIKDFEYCSIKKFEKLKPNTIDECFIADLLDNISSDYKIKFLNDLHQRLKSQGIIYIQSIDRYTCSAAILQKQIDINFLNKILFINNRKTLSCMSETIDLLKNNNFTIDQSKFINGIQYFIKAFKNE